MDLSVPVIAGTTSTIIFAGSTLPMLYKARKTKDLGSYSLGNILLSNLGNLIHSVYVFSLPIGPIWLLHTFYLVTTALMLFWYLRYERRRREGNERGASGRVEGAARAFVNSDWLGQLRSGKLAKGVSALILPAYEN